MEDKPNEKLAINNVQSDTEMEIQISEIPASKEELKRKQKLPGEKISKKQVSQKSNLEKKAIDVSKNSIKSSQKPLLSQNEKKKVNPPKKNNNIIIFLYLKI